jgi:SAM-dependent methyltransferase
MRETSKTIVRRSLDQRFATKYLVGDGIDIGAGPDSIGQYAALFPLMRAVRAWEVPDGDAMLMASVPDESLDFVHSSHCLEHLTDPYVALSNWIRICRPGGYVVVVIPDEDLYEQGVFPSTFSPGHQWTFTISKRQSWSPKSVNLLDLLGHFNDVADVVRIELLDHAYLYGHDRFDQSHLPVTETAIEFILRKRTPEDVERKGVYPTIQR